MTVFWWPELKSLGREEAEAVRVSFFLFRLSAINSQRSTPIGSRLEILGCELDRRLLGDGFVGLQHGYGAFKALFDRAVQVFVLLHLHRFDEILDMGRVGLAIEGDTQFPLVERLALTH